MVIDFGFGLSQLSGSEDLLITLLGKIRSEYTHCEANLTAMFENQQWEEVKVLVHTLKGVSGNLGCVALHQATKTMDDELKYNNAKPRSFTDFVAALDATLELIALVEQAGTVDVNPPAVSTENSNDTRSELIAQLKNNAFIAPDILTEQLQNSGLSNDDQQKVEECINVLDYQQALDVLTR